jgi:hypothetical protein
MMVNKYKCLNCLVIMPEDCLDEDKLCPICRTPPVLMCEVDHACRCWEPVNSGVHYCPICGKPTCPCGDHDVGVVSRVTGYLSDVGGWNNSKKQELKDRHRVNIL